MRSHDVWLNPTLPAPSEQFETAYNQRLPEWRLLANRSANSEHWRNRRECQLAMFGVTLGFNNMLFLPSMAFRHDTYGTFAIQFIILEFLIGFPLLLLQLALGQFTSHGPFQLTKLVPLSEGVGIAFMISNIYMILRQSVFMAWTMFYMLSTFYITTRPKFEWTTAWDHCPRDEELIKENVECSIIPNITNLISADLHCYYTYFLKNVLELSTECSVSDMSIKTARLNWELVGCLMLIWVIGFLFIYRGIQSIGKAVVWVVPITVMLFCVFIIVGITRYQGASEGIKYYFSVNWSHFSDFKMWYTALEHVINSLGLENGTMIVIGAYARFQSPAHYDAFYLCLMDVLFSFLAVLVIFSFIGITAAHFAVSIDAMIVEQQAHYAMFIVFPCALDNSMPFSPFWVFICFGTMLLMTLTSMHTNFLVFLKPLYERHPWFGQNRPLTSMVIVIVFFLGGVMWLLITSNGAWYLQRHAYSWTFLDHWIVVMCFVAAFVYGYGIRRIRADIEFMLHFRPNMFFCVMWALIPFLFVLTVVCHLLLYESKASSYKSTRSLIIHSIAFGINVFPIPALALWNTYWFYKKGIVKRILRPREDSHWEQELARAGVNDEDANLNLNAAHMARFPPVVQQQGRRPDHQLGRWAQMTQSFNAMP